MADFSEINEKLKYVISKDIGKVRDADVAQALGIEPSVYAGMKFRGAVPYREIMNFLAECKISINLFFYGQRINELEESENRLKILRLYDVNASLGGGANNDDERSEDALISSSILERAGIPEMYPIDLIKAVGESMEPYIMDEDVCFIGVGMPYKDGNIYAVNTPDGVVIKECYKQGDELILISYNPVYVPVRYHIAECKIIGKFMGVISGRGQHKIKIEKIDANDF